MKISCLMSVYKKDNPDHLKEAIDSIILQTRTPDEFVIVHDGKINEQQKSVIYDAMKHASYIKLVGYDDNKGLGEALRFGVTQCMGDVIARMDSDDISVSTRFEKEEGFLTSHPEIRLVGSVTGEFISNINNVISYRYVPENNDDIVKYAHTRNPFVHPSIMTYKSDILKAGNYSGDYLLCEDYDLFVRMINNGVKCYNFQEILTYMRISDDFYKRRGGLKYARTIVRFKKHLKQIGFMSEKDYLRSSSSSFIVSMMPNAFRKFIYQKLLRKSNEK